MIGKIIDLLQIDEHKGISDEVEIAKGKYELPLNFKEAIKHVKRWQ